jgi:hypothetical protein
MDQRRLDLQDLLVILLGSNNVYFQPPSNLKLKYPCIIYKRDDTDIKFSNNQPYTNMTRYLVTVVDTEPDSEIHKKVAKLPMCSYSRFYTADNLNHDVYNLYF